MLEPLLPLASTTQDPAVTTNFLAHCAYVNVMAGEYEKGLELVTDVLETSEKLRLTFALPQSLFWKAQAEIGLRRLHDAEATAERLHSLVVDPYTEIINLHLRLRLELASGSLSEWDAYERDFSPQIQRVSVAEFYAIAALWLAAAESPAVERYVALSRSFSSSADARYLADFAELISSHAQGRPRRPRVGLRLSLAHVSRTAQPMRSLRPTDLAQNTRRSGHFATAGPSYVRLCGERMTLTLLAGSDCVILVSTQRQPRSPS